MSNSSNSSNKNEFWKSLREYYNDPEMLKAKVNEFKDGVTDDFDPSQMSGLSRRNFLALLSASAAFTATACSDYRDKGEIIPYNKRPEEVLPGEANYYASTCAGCGQACGILIKTREGRPVKIDGNPDHPINQGKICATGQASILNLYDPDRLTDPKNAQRISNWNSIDSQIITELNEITNNGLEISLVAGTIVSPTTQKVINEFALKFPTTKLYSYSLINDINRRSAWLDSYGSDEYPAVKFDEAEIIVALDSDFLGNEGSFIENLRKFSKKREVIGKTDFNRLYAVEGRMSVTGSLADYRIPLSPNRQLEFVYALINELLKNGSSITIDSAVKSKLSIYSLSGIKDLPKEKISQLISDINANRGKTIVYAGETLDKDVHVAVNLLNEIIGATQLYDYSSSFKSLVKQSKSEEIDALVSSMNSGKVGAVIHFDSNPVFTLSNDYGYASAISKVKTTIALTEAENETSILCKYILPINHSFESWGDAKIRGGVYSTQQPVISPIFNSRQKEAVLLTWISENASFYNEEIYHTYLINNFTNEVFSKSNSFSDAKTFWYSTIHDGIVKTNDSSPKSVFNVLSLLENKQPKNTNSNVVHISNSYYLNDGKFANNGWLQELPHPISKVAWDNYASISPKLAKSLAVEMNDIIEVKVGNKKLNLPVLVQPGVAENVINIELGYGRETISEVGKSVGFNAIKLLSKPNQYIFEIDSIIKTGDVHKLASTQEHHSLDDTFVKDFHRIRNIIKEGTLQKYNNEPHFLHDDKHEIFSITKEHEYKGNKWAMAIDLNKCTNCSACIASCNVENNVPVVGKDQVANGREMQWMRLDRYYSGTPEDPIVSTQPMLCQHCDNAPCENVCPVNATNHSPDGLNQMAYNRCVGTRYCSNNCPYKVRRFNFFDFRDHFASAYYQNDLTALSHNPEVTVRSRGVMEKCTFCVQKIMDARSNAIRDGKELKSEDVVTACQQACPTNAIVFGDANDKESQIANLRNHNLAYHVLEELNVKPNVTYIAKLRNIHSEDVI